MKTRTEWPLAFGMFFLILASTVLLLSGCGGNETEPTQAVETGATLPPAESPMPQPGPTDAAQTDTSTAGTLATSGEEVYVAECSECHGEQGEGLIGPALLGDGANLAAYGTAQGLYDYIHLSMPQDAPGSLTDQQYLEVVTYMLLDNGLVEDETPISHEDLSDIPLQ